MRDKNNSELIPITVRLPLSLVNELEAQADNTGTSLSEVVRSLLNDSENLFQELEDTNRLKRQIEEKNEEIKMLYNKNSELLNRLNKQVQKIKCAKCGKEQEVPWGTLINTLNHYGSIDKRDLLCPDCTKKDRVKRAYGRL